VFDAGGNIHGVAQKEFRQVFPQPGWVEHDPREIWATQVGVAAEALAAAKAGAGGVAAIGITNQRETTVLWDRRTGEPLSNAIVWQDRRTAAWCEALRAGGWTERIRAKTGLLPDAYFSLSKLVWMLENVPGARAGAEAGHLAFGTVDTWLLWNLTGGAVHATDASNASRTMMCNLASGDWDEELLTAFNIPRSLLPAILPSSGVFGETAIETLPRGVPVAGIAGDQQAALFGQACFAPGMAKNTYGTGCFLLQHTGTAAVPSHNNLLTTVASRLDGVLEYALEGSVFIGGAVVQWLRDGLGLIRSAAEIEPLARQVADPGGVYLVPAFAGLGAPHWDPYARGTITGITRGTTAAHLARAALDSIAYQVADLLSAMRADSGIALAELRVDGGAAGNDLLLQFQADLLGVPVVRPAVTETTALGAAYLAGLAVGLLKGREVIAGQWREERRFEPQLAPARAAGMLAGWQRAVERSKGWAG
jgi:glycerol kinase